MEAVKASLCYFFKNWLMKLKCLYVPQEYTGTFILTKKLLLVGLRNLLSISNPFEKTVERPCTKLRNARYFGHTIFSSHPLSKPPCHEIV